MDIPIAQRSRRLPIYILADRSGSMAGDAIVAVNQGLRFLKSDLEIEPRAVQSVWISVISFGGVARVDVPLTELMGYIPPTLDADGSTPLGEALRLLNRSIDNDVVFGGGKGTGDYRPMVFIFTDGKPDDEWRTAAQEVKQRNRAKTANIIAVGCGSQVNTAMLKEITETVLYMESTTGGSFQSLINWISSSVKTASVSKQAVGETPGAPMPVQLPNLPPGITVVL